MEQELEKTAGHRQVSAIPYSAADLPALPGVIIMKQNSYPSGHPGFSPAEGRFLQLQEVRCPDSMWFDKLVKGRSRIRTQAVWHSALETLLLQDT